MGLSAETLKIASHSQFRYLLDCEGSAGKEWGAEDGVDVICDFHHNCGIACKRRAFQVGGGL